MDPKAAELNKSFNSVFILEKSKLSRLLNIIEDKFKSAGIEAIPSFNFTLKNGKNMLAHDIEHVLAHDNSINNPITKLSINYRSSKNGDTSNCVIDYYKDLSKYKRLENSPDIDIFIKSSNVRWANELFAEIEEQIERTLVISLIYKFKRYFGNPIFFPLIPLIMLGIVFIIISLLSPTSISSLSGTDFLSKPDVDRVLNVFQHAKNTDEKIGALSEYHISRLRNIDRTESISISEMIHKIDIKILFILLPLFIMLGGIYYLLKYCYTGSIFIWGDYEDYYNKTVNKRKFIINTIIITLFIGIIGNLFVYAFSKFF